MRPGRKRAAMAGFAVGALLLANGLLGESAAERALQDFDQHVLDAWASKLHLPPGTMKVNGFTTDWRIPLPGFSISRGQSLVARKELSCASRTSVVVWYGVGATVAWQEGVWFPDRTEVHQRVASSGHLE